ncbi:VOC family protein [Egicoccus sp. AB-alg2]|uniref:VOC family protein n=1 Tax=Egicoccus sp. AB-alg2 TaxID=3242693 RepID=UPI00359E88FB
MAEIARLSLFALDCPDARALAEFYSQLTGWPVDDDGGGDADWVELRSDGGITLAFQQVEDYRAPNWPSTDRPQQAHVDFDVPDLDEGERRVLAIGARKAEYQPGETFRVYLDPVGHPFCLVLNRDA